MSILITGVAGFIGSNLASQLLDDGHKVVGIDNFCRGSKSNINELLKNSSFKKLFTILNNKKSKKICDYIIIIEEYINRYKDSIIKSLKIIN